MVALGSGRNVTNSEVVGRFLKKQIKRCVHNTVHNFRSRLKFSLIHTGMISELRLDEFQRYYLW
jgi:hypothetical protein